MEDLVGSIFLRDNSNLSFTGDNNNGKVTDNSNVKLHGQSSTLDINNNSNCKISVTNSEITASSCSNSDVSGSGNKLFMKDNSNTGFNGDNNVGEIISNSNLKFGGNNGRFKLLDNSNANIRGNGNYIEAKGNSNLKVEGNQNQVTISDTFNHQVNTLEEQDRHDGSASNLIEVIPNQIGQLSSVRGRSWFGNWFGRNNFCNANLRFCITYLKAAKIVSNRYELGIFKFNLEDGSEPSVLNLRLDTAELDDNSLNITCIGNGKCVVLGTKNGEKQKLQIVGPLVKHCQEKDPKLFSINYQTQSLI